MRSKYCGITVDYSRDRLFDETGLKTLRENYMRPEETSPQERFALVSNQFSSNKEHAQRLYDYSSKHWLSYSTPILSYGRNNKGLGISCYINYMLDTAEGLVDSLAETSWLSMYGGGVGINLGIRSADDKSVGVMPHMKVYDAACLAYRQGKTRRGSYAAYLDIDHPDIIQFIEMRKPTGDHNIRCQNLHHAINISDKFMGVIERCMVDPKVDDTWELKDPNGNVVSKVSARDLWQKIIETRAATGEPYIMFKDTANRALPQWLKDKGFEIHGSNICTEIMLPTSNTRTAVCCLSSLNLEYFDEWKDNKQFYRDVAEMLDNVLNHFISHAPKTIQRAINSAQRERSIGIGALGFHSYLQSHSVAFEGAMAKSINYKIFSTIRTALDKVNLALGKERGEAPDAKGTGRRFSHVMAIAPNASTSIIMGNVSPSIEPFRANAYRQDTLTGSHFAKNKYLNALLKERLSEQELEKTWTEITSNDGSVQNLKCLDENEKAIFKTAMEIDQRWIISLASDRQQFIDQGQSINLFFSPTASIAYLHAIHFMAWKGGLKSLYYHRSDSIRRADKISKNIERQIIEELTPQKLIDNDVCLACQG